MTYIEAILLALACGYAALTIVGIATTLWIVDFINKSVGRNVGGEGPPPWYYYILGLFYIFVYMWAIGLVASREGGRTMLATKRAQDDMKGNNLSLEEKARLRDACETLKVTSRFTS